MVWGLGFGDGFEGSATGWKSCYADGNLAARLGCGLICSCAGPWKY